MQYGQVGAACIMFGLSQLSDVGHGMVFQEDS